MKRLMLIILMGGLTASTWSAPDLFTDTYNFGSDGLIWDAQNHSWAEFLVGSNPTVNWTHLVPDILDPSLVFSAELTIAGQGIENVLCDWDGDGPEEAIDSVKIYLNDNYLGNLMGNTTTFSLSPDILAQNDVYSATINFVYDGKRSLDKLWPVDSVMLTSSVLNIWLEQAQTQVPTPIVPAPGAMTLGSIGVVLVGWLRNRRTI